MSDSSNPPILNNAESALVLRYSLVPFAQWKTAAIFLLSLSVFIAYAAWLVSNDFRMAVLVIGILFLSLGSSIFPSYYEFNPEGIKFARFGRKYTVLWVDIVSYDVLRHGILILPTHERYFFVPFRGLFIPIPDKFAQNVLRRFAANVSPP